MPIKFLLLGGGGSGFFLEGGGGSAKFIFMGAGIFPRKGSFRCMKKGSGEPRAPDNLPNSTRNPTEPYSDKEKSFEAVAL